MRTGPSIAGVRAVEGAAAGAIARVAAVVQAGMAQAGSRTRRRRPRRRDWAVAHGARAARKGTNATRGRAVEGEAGGAVAQVPRMGRAGNDGDDVGAVMTDPRRARDVPNVTVAAPPPRRQPPVQSDGQPRWLGPVPQPNQLARFEKSGVGVGASRRAGRKGIPSGAPTTIEVSGANRDRRRRHTQWHSVCV